MTYEMYRQQFEGESFNDVLADQLRRAPWLLISLFGHAVILLLIWLLHRPDDKKPELPEVNMAMDEIPPEEEEEEIIEPEIEEPEPEELVEDPVPVEEEVDEHDEDETNEEFEEVRGEEDQVNDRPFDSTSNNDAIGLGGGAGGAFGGRRGGRNRARKGGGRRGQAAVDKGLEWLARHQTIDIGMWDSDEFMKNGDPERGPLCDGKGGPLYDTGLTGLALLAFLGAGETHRSGDYRKNVRAALKWLNDQQDAEGCFGSRTAQNFTYNHAIAALAMCEAYGLTKSPLFKSPAEKGIAFVGQCQNPYKAWRYGIANGENDTSVTGWMVMALKSAKQADIAIDDNRLDWAVAFVDEMTDPETGRTGYIQRGSAPVRENDKLTEFPATESESLTAVGVLCRIFNGEDPTSSTAIKLGTDLMLEKLPVWDEARGSIDMYYWYYGTLAMYQVAGNAWNSWNEKMQEAVIETQRADGNFAGSWDPKGAWGEAGGRVYSTAIMTLCLEVYYRYGRVFGTK